MRTINLCKGCIEDLSQHNPYIDKKGNTIPIDDLQINVVTNIKDCDNYKIGEQWCINIHASIILTM